VVEDVPETVPLGRALQRHRNDVVGAAETVREALGCSSAAHAPRTLSGGDRVARRIRKLF
jgi:hypothetical protein